MERPQLSVSPSPPGGTRSSRHFLSFSPPLPPFAVIQLGIFQRFYLGIGDAGRETRLQYSAGERLSSDRDVIICSSCGKLAQ